MLAENKYKEGEIVCDRIRPAQEMVVKRYSNKTYYCILKDAPHRKAIVYMERDLVAARMAS